MLYGKKNTKIYKLLGIIVNGLMIIYDVYIKSILQQSNIYISLCCNFISNFVPYGSQEVNRGQVYRPRFR